MLNCRHNFCLCVYNRLACCSYFLVFKVCFNFLNLNQQLKYQKSDDETNELEEMTNLETVQVLEGVALQHGFVGRLVSI